MKLEYRIYKNTENKWAWMIIPDIEIDTSEFPWPLYGVSNSALPGDVMSYAIKVGSEFQLWYWNKQQLSLDFGLD